jgi:hypothetical protein
MIKLPATAEQIAWYIERDGATYFDFEADGSRKVRVPLGSQGHATYRIPADMVEEIESRRDRVYRLLAEKRRSVR